MRDHMPSDLVPLHDGMILSFVNYELRVKIERKTGDDMKKQTDAQTEFFAQRDYEMNLESSMKAAAAPVPEPVTVPEVNVDDAQPVKEEAPQTVVEDPVPVAEEPVKESAPAEEEKKEEPVVAAEEPKTEEPIAEEPKAEEPKEEEKPAEAIPVEEPVAAEEKKEEPVAAEAE
jgi:predicted component of type VI protein secretion system